MFNRLFGLINYALIIQPWDNGEFIETEANIEEVVNYLLENSVIVPPCKIGDIFYGLNEAKTDYHAYEVLGFKWGKRRGDDENVLFILSIHDTEFVWGEEAFLTQVEAEKALKGGK